MGRTVKQVLDSGYLTAAEALAINFELALEENEANMPEGAAIAVTCERFGVQPELVPVILMEIPQGEWWTVAGLPESTDARSKSIS